MLALCCSLIEYIELEKFIPGEKKNDGIIEGIYAILSFSAEAQSYCAFVWRNGSMCYEKRAIKRPIILVT